MELIALGSDPESFLEDESGKVISAIGKIGGTKDTPKPIKELGKGFAVQEDNVLLEYNTPPAKALGVWCSFHRNVRAYLKEWVGKQLGLRLSARASCSMPQDQLDHPKAWVFGCDPDYDVWACKWNKKPHAEDPNLRSSGGHIHVAYDNPNVADSVRIGRALDYWVGAPLKQLDPDEDRARLYGKAGAIRFKPYGLEYRTPSNWWTLSEKATEAVYYNVVQALGYADQYDEYEHFFQTAKLFLDGDSKSFDTDLIRSRGMSYGEKTSSDPLADKLKAKLKMDIAAAKAAMLKDMEMAKTMQFHVDEMFFSELTLPKQNV